MNFEDDEELLSLIEKHEGIMLKPYLDTAGKLTIGIGRNLDDVGISKEEAYYLLKNDIIRVVKELDQHISWWREKPIVAQRVLIDMAFNMGIYRLLSFKNMLSALERNDYKEASKEMLNSKWAQQVKRRAVELAKMIESLTSSYV